MLCIATIRLTVALCHVLRLIFLLCLGNFLLLCLFRLVPAALLHFTKYFGLHLMLFFQQVQKRIPHRRGTALVGKGVVRFRNVFLRLQYVADDLFFAHFRILVHNDPPNPGSLTAVHNGFDAFPPIVRTLLSTAGPY